MEIEQKKLVEIDETRLPEGTQLISVAVPLEFVKQKKAYAVNWRRIVRLGLDSLDVTKKDDLELINQKLTRVNQHLELALQRANERLEKYEKIYNVSA